MSVSKKKKSVILRKIFWNDKAILAISIFAAVVVWASVCVAFAPETTNIIKDVPVVVSTENDVPSQYGFQLFGEKDFTVDITVSGSRYVIGENLLSADDFEVYAITSNVAKAGHFSLQLKVRKVNEDADYKIVGVSKDSVSVYYDSFEKKEVPVTVSVNKTDFVKSGYMTDENYIMDKKTAVVSGAAGEVAKLDSVIADVQLDDGQISETTTYNAVLTAYDKTQTALEYVQINGEDEATMPIGIPVYRMGSHGLDVQFTNVPSAYSSDVKSFLEYSFSPSGLNVAVLQNGTENDNIDIGVIDFSQIKKGENKFKFPLSTVKSIKADSTNVKTVVVSFDLPEISEKKVALLLDNASVVNTPEDSRVLFGTSYVNVQLYGKKSELEKLDSQSLKAVIDFNNNTSDEDGVYKGAIYLKDAKSSWIYGTYELPYTLTK